MTQRQVILDGGLPWGFRMHGGVDVKTPLKVSRVNPGSRAAQRGIREGDLITSINGQSTQNLTNNEAHNLLRNSGSTLSLGLNEDIEGSPKRRQYRTIHQETHQETVKRSTYSIKETFETTTRKENNQTRPSTRISEDYFNGKDSKQNGREVRIVTNIPVSQKSTPSSSSTSTPSTLVPEGKNISSDHVDHALASRQSSYSNCSSIPDEGLVEEDQHFQDDDMNNGEDKPSKSKKRRQRRKNLLGRNQQSESDRTTNEIETCSMKNEMKDVKNIDILKLKRIEHRYTVESPKEIKIENLTNNRKQIVKSKSLDGDEFLKIQELSEASESEDVKTQSNVVISEASSEENILDDIEPDHHRMNSLSLQLNDNNEVEAVSHISPAEERALRDYLGGLNLVGSPEESAKQLYDQTVISNDPKTRKEQKRRELQQYFLPIAENPRFLEAISEEASDLSDRETHSTNKEASHLKQCSPEQDMRQIPPPIPPRPHELNGFRKYENPQSSVVLVETKILTPENTQGTVYSAQIVSPTKETAEVVYLDDSGESVSSSTDCEEEWSDGEEHVDESSTNKEPNDLVLLSNTDLEDAHKANEGTVRLCNNIGHTNIDTLTELNKKSDEISPKTSTEDTISGISSSVVFSQILTPPPTPDEVTEASAHENLTSKNITFDYTKIPNVLTSKEPGNGKNSYRKDVNVYSEHETISETKTSSMKTKKQVDYTDNCSFEKNIDKKHISEEHLFKSIENGTEKCIEYKKINLDEMCQNGNKERKKIFEEFKDNKRKLDPTFEAQERLSKNIEISNDNNKEDELNKKDTVEYIHDKTNRNLENGKQNNLLQSKSECTNRIINNENMNNGYEEVKTEKYYESISGNGNYRMNGGYDKNVTCNLLNGIGCEENSRKLIDMGHEGAIRDKQVEVNYTIIENNNVKNNIIHELFEINQAPKKTMSENILRHVIMTSNSSNKTDTEKLKDFDNLLMLNHELKEKISRKELIGPKFRKSKSPNNGNTVSSEKLPGRTFVEKRVKKFSNQSIDFEKQEHADLENESILRHFITNRENHSEKIDRAKESKEDSVLKRFIGQGNTDDRNANLTHKDKNDLFYTNKENNLNNPVIEIPITNEEPAKEIFISKEKPIRMETLVNISNNKFEEKQTNLQNLPSNQMNFGLAKETIIPVTVEKSTNESSDIYFQNHRCKEEQTDFHNSPSKQSNLGLSKEILIPVKVEESATDVDIKNNKFKEKHTNLPNLQADFGLSKEIIIPITIKESNNTSSDVGIQSHESKKEETIFHNSPSKQSSSGGKETLIPIAIEKSDIRSTDVDIKNNKSKEKHTNLPDLQSHQADVELSKEMIIPITIEESNNTSSDVDIQSQESKKEKTNFHNSPSKQSSSGGKETLIPITIEKSATGSTDVDIKNNKSKEKQTNLPNLPSSQINFGLAKETLIPVTVEKSTNESSDIYFQNHRSREEQTDFHNSPSKQSHLGLSKETLIPITIEKSVTGSTDVVIQNNKEQTNLQKSNETLVHHHSSDSDDVLGNKPVVNIQEERIIPITIERTNNINSNEKKVSEERMKSREKIIPVTIEREKSSQNQQNKNRTTIKKDTIITNIINTNKETIIPVSIENNCNEQEIDKTNSSKYNTKVIPIINEENKEHTDEEQNKSKGRIIPVRIETQTANVLNDHNNCDISKETLKEMNETLKNIGNNKDQVETDYKNSILLENSRPEKEEIVKVNKIKEENQSKQKINEKICETNLNVPPVPPPRKPKNIKSKTKATNKAETNTSTSEVSKESTFKDSKDINHHRDSSGTNFNSQIPISDSMTYTNILSPPRPASAGSDSTDSEESSRCTAKYNPNSSIGDVTSITKEEESGEIKETHEPQSLRSIVLNFFLSFPFGEEILREIAEVSKSIDNFTNKIPFKGLSNVDSVKVVKDNDILATRQENMQGGMYTQRDVERNEYGDERHRILELHEKFLTRRRCGEGDSSGNNRDSDDIIMSERETNLTTPNRLLHIIREEPSESENLNDSNIFEDQRLNAKNLNEWLILARNKSKSTSNLDCTNIPINNLRKTFNNEHTGNAKFSQNRRRSLPQEIYEKQMIDIMEKEREIQRELENLEEEKRKLRAEMAPSRQKEFQVDDFYVSKKGDFAEIRELVERKQRPASMPVFPTEFFRQQMYDEYVDKFTEREERKQQKVIKISSSHDLSQEATGSNMKIKEILHPIKIEQEFMDKVKQKLGNRCDSDTAPVSNLNEGDEDDDKHKDPPVIVIDGDKVKGVESLPKHLQEFVDDLTAVPEYSIWSPGQQYTANQTPPSKSYQRSESQNTHCQGDETISPVWTPKSANTSPTVERKEFRTVSFQSPVLSRKSRTKSETIQSPDSTSSERPWKIVDGSSDSAINLTSTLDRRLSTSQSSPGFGSLSTSPNLPKAQNPTITLLQKAREGQLPRGAQYIDQDKRPPNDRPPIKYPGEVLYQIKNEYTSESDSERPRKMADLAPRKFEGIGPTSKDGMPLVLRSEIKDKDQSKWYKRMYETIHKQKPHKDEFVTIRYKQKRAQYPYTSGYLSEPEPGAYDSDFTEYKYQTLDRRRTPQTHEYINKSSTMPRNVPDKSYSSSDIIKSSQERYQPGRIENYMPSRSSISEKEAKQWWDEVMDIFDGHLEQQNRLPTRKPKSFINQALKESGYESDSTLIFKRKEDTASQLSPKEQRQAYKMIQKGGDVPFQGLRKPAPERPKETDLVEFFPISPTLTKIRIHKSVIPAKENIPQQEFFCYPVNIHHNMPKTFTSFKRAVPFSVNIGKVPTPPPIPTPPPSPPKRRSSRNNSTLRLISTMKVKNEKSPVYKRHETCFTSGATTDRTKVNYLKDKITCKLSPSSKRRGESSKITVVKKMSASPELKSKITSSLTTSRDPRTSLRKVQSSTKIYSDKTKTPSLGLYKSGSTGSITSKKSSTESLASRASTPARTFGTEKRKFDLTLPKASDSKVKLSKASSEELLSPTEVKKGMKNISFSNASYKSSYALLSSAKNSNTNDSLPIKVGFTEKGKNILKSAIKRSVSESPKVDRKWSTLGSFPSASSERSKTKSSTESLNSTKQSKKSDKLSSSSKAKIKTEDKKNHKSKKDQINDGLKQKSKISHDQIGSKVSDKNKTENMEPDSAKKTIGSNHFFRSLFLRNLKPSASFSSPKNSWLVEKTNQLSRRRSSCSEPSIGAMKIYLKHTRPVSDSKFISLDIIRSRSVSPKSVTFSDNVRTDESEVKNSKRSRSSPAKLVFSQTSRPISPVVTRKYKSPILKPKSKENLVTIRRSPSPQTKLFFSETSRPISPEVKRKFSPSPLGSPLLPRSPSCRRIMQIKHQQSFDQNKPHELTLYTCPEFKSSTTSLDSFRSEDYQIYLKDIVFGSTKSEKFKDLNHFYSDIEKVGNLEQKFELKPRKKSENEIIDFDRWKEVRMREKAEHELRHLYNHLRSHEKDKGFLFLPKDVEKYKWKKEFDRGLRIKEKSVENIKEEFEKLEREESERENARRREITYSKDTYKPLWRGNSVSSLVSNLSERRSQSEGRIKTTRQKLLDNERILNHKIGSRIWSSLSIEQVNNLKKQLQEIYGDESPISKTDHENNVKEYIVEVPRYSERPKFSPYLTVRRNSEGSKHDLMSENEKKMISQTLSREVLEKVAQRRKEDKLALPLVVGKEVLGAKASKEAGLKSKNQEPEKALTKTNAVSPPKTLSMSEGESGSTDESTKTVINLKDVQKKVEYFENAKALDTYIPTVYKPAEDGSVISEGATSPSESEKQEVKKKKGISQSKSCQNFKEYFGETNLVKFATLPLSATRKHDHVYTKKPLLRALDISPIRSISEANSIDSLNRSRSNSPYFEETQALAKKGEVKKLKKQFEFFEDFFGEKKLKRSRSESDLRMYGHVDDLRRKYEYPVHSGRGRSRTKRGGVVSPIWLRPEDRYMPHINIISKIASLYSFSKNKTAKEASKSMEELAEILGCHVGEVEKMKEKFDKLRLEEEQISLMGHMYTSSPNLKELRDITPYLTANWIAHKYPRSEDNTRSLSSPDTSIASRDTSLVRRDRHTAKSSSSNRKGQQYSILKETGQSKDDRFESSSRYTKEPDFPPPPPPPKSQGEVRSQEQESPRKYVENEVTIHYKTPVRTEIKEYVSEDELAHRQAEAMKKIYEEERKRKYFQVSRSLQELQDMKSRRHTDNFIPSQKSPISLNRYDDFDDLATPTKTRPRSPEPRLVARALYNFVGQTAKELTFRKGDLIYVRRQVDKNWYEGELNAMVGLFPVNYVEIVPYEGPKTTPRKSHEGQARAKYNFLAQTHLELSLAKGELVTITRRVDENWFEGKIGGRKGIFPVAYVEVLIDPSDPPPPSNKPVAAPASHSLLLNGSAQGKDSMGSHLYTPNMTNPITSKETGYHRAKPVQLSGAGTYSTLPKSSNSPIDQALHIETQNDPIPYKALYRYTPQNDDELELLEGDTVYVLEKCDDGWYVGSSERTGAFGTFPGNYVEKM